MAAERAIVPILESFSPGSDIDIAQIVEDHAKTGEALEKLYTKARECLKQWRSTFRDLRKGNKLECFVPNLDMTHIPKAVQESLNNPQGKHLVELTGWSDRQDLRIKHLDGELAAWVMVTFESSDGGPTHFQLWHYPGEDSSEPMIPTFPYYLTADTILAALIYEKVGPALADAMETRLTPHTTKTAP